MGRDSGCETRPVGVADLRYGAVIAPGYGGSSEQPIVQAMARRIGALGIVAKTISFTRAKPGGDFGPELDDLRRAREELIRHGVHSAALIGRSFGGRMCTRLAVLESPPALVLLGHPIAPPNRPRPDDEAALAAVTCPTLIVRGANDRLGPPAALLRSAKHNHRIDTPAPRAA